MVMLGFLIFTHIVAFYIGNKVHPSIKKEDDGWYLYYNLGKGTRNKTKLF